MVTSAADEREALLARGGGACKARPLCGRLRKPTPSRRFRRCTGSTGSPINLADTQPVLLTVDDAHLADRRILALADLSRPPAGGRAAGARAGDKAGRARRGAGVARRVARDPGGRGPSARRPERAGDHDARSHSPLAADPDPASLPPASGRPAAIRSCSWSSSASSSGAESRRVARTPAWPSQLSSQGVGRAVRARLRRLPTGCIALARAVAVLGELSRADPRSAACRPRRRRSLPRRRRARQGADSRSRPAACVRPHARAIECLLRDELPGACPKPRARCPPAEKCGRSTAIGSPYTCWRPSPGGNAETVNTLRRRPRAAAIAAPRTLRSRT